MRHRVRSGRTSRTERGEYKLNRWVRPCKQYLRIAPSYPHARVLRYIFHFPMLIVRIEAAQPNAASAEINLTLFEEDGCSRLARIPFNAPTSPELVRDVGWLMEDFLQDATAAAPVRAAEIHQRINEEGERLFHALFQETTESSQIWELIEPRLQDVRFEISACTAALASTLWEQIRPSQLPAPLCLAAHSFVRVVENQQGTFGVRDIDVCRVLLITSRPAGPQDVTYRSIAAQAYSALRSVDRCSVTLLRPPTFSECARALRDARAAGHAFDIVHFDGHGTVVNDASSSGSAEGYILFEDAEDPRGRLVSGRDFAQLLADTGTAAVVLNACRSAHVALPAVRDGDARETIASSFSHDLIKGRVRIVVAMSHNVYVASAKRFIAEFYRQISIGHSIGRSAALARKDMATDSTRSDGLASFHIADWMVPTVLQSGDDLAISSGPAMTSDGQPETVLAAATSTSLPPDPDLGFIGADDTLLAIDRALDSSPTVLVHGLAGGGKTATAVEFARWYQSTGGTSQVLFTSFEEMKSVESAIAEFEPLLLRRAGPRWPHLSVSEQIKVAPALLEKGTLWIWDNVETVNSLPAADRADIIAFLRAASAAGIRFVLTSRGRETALLANLCVRVELAPLRFDDSAEFARVLLTRLGRSRVERSTLIELLLYCEGNPLTLTVALANLLDKYENPSASQVTRFVRDLRSGQLDLDDEDVTDKSRSLAASLDIAFAALNQTARRRVALLHLFRRYANVNVLVMMFHRVRDGILPADYDFDWVLREFAEDTPKTFDHALRRASDLGLLRRSKAEHYWLHPALHQHLKKYFRKSFPRPLDAGRVRRAFAESLAAFSILFALEHSLGRREAISDALSDEEDNLLHAFALSREFNWYQATTGLMHGIFTLYWHTGRRREWEHLLTSVLPAFLDDDGHAQPGKERWWSFMMDQAIRLEMWRRDLESAERLARIMLDHEEQTTAALMASDASTLTADQQKQLQSLAITLSRIADILRERDDPSCVDISQRALAIYERIDDPIGVPIRLFNLGHTFKNIAAIRDLARAEQYYRQAFDRYTAVDTSSRFQCVAQLGAVALQRLKDEFSGEQRQDVLASHVDDALASYHEVLEHTAPDDILGLANVHNQLGVAYQYIAHEQELAFEHFRLAIEYFDRAGESYEAATARNNAAQSLQRLHRYAEALVLAREALATLESSDPTDGIVAHVRKLVADLQGAVAGNS